MWNDYQMDAKVTPLHPDDDEVSEDLVGDEEWLSTEQEWDEERCARTDNTTSLLASERALIRDTLDV